MPGARIRPLGQLKQPPFPCFPCAAKAAFCVRRDEEARRAGMETRLRARRLVLRSTQCAGGSLESEDAATAQVGQRPTLRCVGFSGRAPAQRRTCHPRGEAAHAHICLRISEMLPRSVAALHYGAFVAERGRYEGGAYPHAVPHLAPVHCPGVAVAAGGDLVAAGERMKYHAFRLE